MLCAQDERLRLGLFDWLLTKYIVLKSKLVLDFTATLNIASPASSINFLKINHWSSPLILTRTGSDWFRKLTAPGVMTSFT